MTTLKIKQINEFSVSSPTSGQVLAYNGSKFVNSTPTSFSTSSSTISTTTSPTTFSSDLTVYLCTAALTFTLPAPTNFSGKQVVVKSFTTGAVTINCATSVIVYDSASAVNTLTHPANNPGFSTTFYSNGTYWIVI